MLFEAFPLPSYEIENFVKNKFLNKRSLKAGERVIQLQKQKYGLFYEEFAEYKTPLERAEYNINKFISLYKDRRKTQAQEWKRARKRLKKLPRDLKFLAYQNYKNFEKYTPERLNDFITKALTVPDNLFFNIWIYNAEKRSQNIKSILQTSLKMRFFYNFVKEELRKKSNVNYLEVNYFKGNIILTGFPDREIKKLNKKQEEKLIKSFNCFFKNSENKILQNRSAKKVIYINNS